MDGVSTEVPDIGFDGDPAEIDTVRHLQEMLRQATEAARSSSAAAQAAVTALTASRSSADVYANLSGRDLVKVLPKPEAFMARNREEELSLWRSWGWTLAYCA